MLYIHAVAAGYKRLPAALVFGLTLVRAADGQETPASALQTLNAYLAQAARLDPAYRADIELGEPPGKGTGRLSGYSHFLGPFSYRPKIYGELSPAERAVLLREPGLHAFLAARSGLPENGSRPALPTAAPSRIPQFSVSAGDILGTRAVRVTIPPQ